MLEKKHAVENLVYVFANIFLNQCAVDILCLYEFVCSGNLDWTKQTMYRQSSTCHHAETGMALVG